MTNIYKLRMGDPINELVYKNPDQIPFDLIEVSSSLDYLTEAFSYNKEMLIEWQKSVMLSNLNIESLDGHWKSFQTQLEALSKASEHSEINYEEYSNQYVDLIKSYLPIIILKSSVLEKEEYLPFIDTFAMDGLLVLAPAYLLEEKRENTPKEEPVKEEPIIEQPAEKPEVPEVTEVVDTPVSEDVPVTNIVPDLGQLIVNVIKESIKGDQLFVDITNKLDTIESKLQSNTSVDTTQSSDITTLQERIQHLERENSREAVTVKGLMDEINTYKEKIASLEEKLSTPQVEDSVSREEFEEEQARNKVTVEEYKTLKIKYLELKDQRNECQGTLTLKEMDIVNLQEKNEALNKGMEELHKKLIEAQNKDSELEQQENLTISGLRIENETLTNKIDQLEQEIADLKTKVDNTELQEELVAANNKIEQLQSELDKNESLKADYNSLVDDYEKANQEIEVLKTKIPSDDTANAGATINKLNEDLATVNGLVKERNLTIQELMNEIAELRNRPEHNPEDSNKIKELEEANNTLRTELEQRQANSKKIDLLNVEIENLRNKWQEALKEASDAKTQNQLLLDELNNSKREETFNADGNIDVFDDSANAELMSQVFGDLQPETPVEPSPTVDTPENINLEDVFDF